MSQDLFTRRAAKVFLGALLALLALALEASPAAADPGPGDLLVAPTRLVFEPRDRTAEITLVNRSDRPATYRISFVELRMDEFGATREISREEALPGELFASDLIRFSPRQVSLEPGVAQTVRLQLRRPADSAPGERRSHLLFRAVPEGVLETESPAASGLAVNLRAVYGVSIPVIVRQGEEATARLSGLALQPPGPGGGDPALRFRLDRSGSASLYANLVATFQPAKGKKILLGQVNGVAVYSPNSSRSGALALRIPAALREQRGEMHLAYVTADQQVLAEAELAIQ